MGISRRLRDVTCQSLLAALRRGVGSRRRGLTLLGSLDPVDGPSEPRGKTTPPKPGGAWHIHTTTTHTGAGGRERNRIERRAPAWRSRRRSGAASARDGRERTPWVDAVRWKAHVSEATSDVSNQSRDAEGVIVAHGGGAIPAHAPTLPIILARWGTMLGTCEGRVGTSATMHGACISDYETMLGVGE